MNETNSDDVLNFAENSEVKLPSTLNVLTILTLIACAFELYSDVKNFISGKEALQKLQDAQSQLDTAPGWLKKFAGPEMLEMAQKAYDNRIPILIIALLSVGLCIFGAIEMRKLKKQGYLLWLVGEVLPIVSSIIFIGTMAFQSFVAIFFIFPV